MVVENRSDSTRSIVRENFGYGAWLPDLGQWLQGPRGETMYSSLDEVMERVRAAGQRAEVRYGTAHPVATWDATAGYRVLDTENAQAVQYRDVSAAQRAGWAAARAEREGWHD